MANVKVKGPQGFTVMSVGALAAEFEASFWPIYPKRRAKKYALKAYGKARAEATAEQIAAGVQQYVAHKPDWMEWAFPASWLNAARYFDEYDKTKTAPTKTIDEYLADMGHWSVGCKKLHGGTCANGNEHYARLESVPSPTPGGHAR